MGGSSLVCWDCRFLVRSLFVLILQLSYGHENVYVQMFACLDLYQRVINSQFIALPRKAERQRTKPNEKIVTGADDQIARGSVPKGVRCQAAWQTVLICKSQHFH